MQALHKYAFSLIVALYSSHGINLPKESLTLPLHLKIKGFLGTIPHVKHFRHSCFIFDISCSAYSRFLPFEGLEGASTSTATRLLGDGFACSHFL